MLIGTIDCLEIAREFVDEGYRDSEEAAARGCIFTTIPELRREIDDHMSTLMALSGKLPRWPPRKAP